MVFNPANQIIHPAVYWGTQQRTANTMHRPIRFIPKMER